MPTITLDRNVLEKLSGKKLSDEKLKDRISMLGTGLEKIDGNEIHVEIFPNRPDLLSEQGFARAFSSFIGTKPGLRKYKVEKSGEKVIIEKSVAGIRPFTACAIIKGLKLDNEKIREIVQIQEKLHITYGRNRKKCAIGIYPFEKIKPPITFSAKKPSDIRFQPLGAYKEMTGIQILSQHPTGREYGNLLEGLDRFPVFTDSSGQVLSMPPVINSEQTGKVSESTTDVFVECSGFDFGVLEKCLNIIVASLYDMGGKVFSMELEYGKEKKTTPSLEPVPMKIDISYISRIAGVDFSESRIKELLAKMGIGYEKGKALVPAYRADILHQSDIVEEVCIAHGYENIEPEIPKVPSTAQQDKFFVFRERIADILAGLGFVEVRTYHLTSRENQSSKMNTKMHLIDLANPNTREYSVLRQWVIPSLMEVFESNRHNEYPQKIFDIGTVFKKGETETGIEEAERLAVAICSENADFTSIRQVFDYVMRMIGSEASVRHCEHPSFISGRVGRAKKGDSDIAFIGEICPESLSEWGIQFPVAAFELNLTELFKELKK